MQEDTSGGKRQQVVGLGSEGVRSSLQNLKASQDRLYSAKSNRTEADNNKRINTINAYKDAGLTALKVGTDIAKQQANEMQQTTLSAFEVGATRRKIEFEDKVADGGEIDKLDIPQEQKKAMKIAEANAYFTNEKKLAEQLNDDSFLEKIFATDKKAVKKYQTKRELELTEQENEYKRTQQVELNKETKLKTTGNLQSMVARIGNANSEEGVDTRTAEVLNSVDRAVNGGILSTNEAELYKQAVLGEADDRKVEVRINNARNNPNLMEAIYDMQEAYEGTTEGNIYFNSNNSVENNTKFRNELERLLKKVEDGYVDSVINTVDYSQSANTNRDYLAQITAGKPPKVQQKVLDEYAKMQKEYSEKPINFFTKRNPNATVEEKQAWLNSQGMGQKTILSENSKAVESIQNDFSRIGNLRNADGKPFDNIKQEFDIVFTGIEKEFYIQPKPYETEREANERQSKINQLILKEVKIHGGGMDYLLTKAKIEGNDEVLNNLLKVKRQQNSPEGFIGAGNKAITDMQNFTSKALEYEKRQDPTGYSKIENALLDYANYYNKDTAKAVKEVYANKEYIVDEKNTISLNPNEYTKSEVEGRIAILKKNPIDFLKQINALPPETNTFIGKYDLKANLHIMDDGANNLILTLKSQRGDKDQLAIISIDDLPPLKWIPDYSFIKQGNTGQGSNATVNVGINPAKNGAEMLSRISNASKNKANKEEANTSKPTNDSIEKLKDIFSLTPEKDKLQAFKDKYAK